MQKNIFYCISLQIFLIFTSIVFLPIKAFAAEDGGGSEGYQFDEKLLVGNGFLGQDISRFNQANRVDPGRYMVDIYLNKSFISRSDIDFKAVGKMVVSPCLADELLVRSGVSPASLQAKNAVGSPTAKTKELVVSEPNCMPLSERMEGALSYFDFSRLRLDISIPQIMMDRVPRGSVGVGDLDAGSSMLFSNYSANYYRSVYSGPVDQVTDFSFLGLHSGVNFGLWRFRQQSSYRYSNSASGSHSEWKNINFYAQRALPVWGSELTLGDSFTRGSLFSSLAFRGAKIETDERMLPESVRSYAPHVRGVALTNARVRVMQNGNAIYETNVAPGPFVIDDLSGSSAAGDLQVEVVEADGRRSDFTVPFTAVPESMRPGARRYSATLGKVRNQGERRAIFSDVDYQYGFSNSVTLNTGVRVSKDYFALLGGGVLGSSYGAFGLNSTYSQAKLENARRDAGWRLQATYSKSIQKTATNISLAGYRYSTKGYRELGDVLGVREADRRGETWSSSSFKQRNQLTATISQSLGDWGQFYLSGSSSDYYDGRNRDTQLQVGYSNTWKQISYNISLIRQDTRADLGAVVEPGLDEPWLQRPTRPSGNMLMFSLSMPIGVNLYAPFLSTSVTHSKAGGTTYQSGLSGAVGDNQSLSYGVDIARNTENRAISVGGSLQKRLATVTVGGNLSKGENYWQASANARGAAVVHGGGLTLGPYLGETFGLIEAKGAAGAEVRNGQGARIDSAGYALVPSLSAYRYNDVGLNSDGLNATTELQENQRRVAPYAGASVKIQFKTLTGYAVLIKAVQANGALLPLGANVQNAQGHVVGMVGQASQVYARVEGERGHLRVVWGETAAAQCTLAYDLGVQDRSQTLFRLAGPCVTAKD